MRVIVAILSLCLTASAGAELVLNGVDDELAANVRSYVGLAKEPCTAEPWLVRRRFARIADEAAEALEPFGYYAPSIETELEFTDGCWRASVDIAIGSPVTWRKLDIDIRGTAADETDFTELLDNPELQVGAPARHSAYETLKRDLQTRALDRGYVDAEFSSQQVDVWPDEGAADISLQFDSGARYSIGAIEVEDSVVTPTLLDAYVNLEPGSPYDSREINRAYRDLAGSGYFRRVSVLPLFENAAERRIPVRIELEPAERIEYTVGAGFATDTGPRLRAGYRNRRVNRRGHRFNADLTVSPVISGLVSEYRRPVGDPRSDWMSYTAAIDVEDTDTSESEAFRIGLRRTRQISDWWMRTLSIDYSYDQFTVADNDDISRLLLPAVAFEYKRADSDLYPQRGLGFQVEVRGAHEALGSNTNVLQMVARGRWIRALNEDSRLLARAAVGATLRDEFSELPPSLRFFAGGDESVRGYGFNTLGPEDDAGEVIGGSTLLVASIEYEHRLRGNFFGALFFDAGNAYDDGAFDPAYGTGVGVKWRSPVGPISLYLAHPLNQSNQDLRVHVSLGVEL